MSSSKWPLQRRNIFFLFSVVILTLASANKVMFSENTDPCFGRQFANFYLAAVAETFLFVLFSFFNILNTANTFFYNLQSTTSLNEIREVSYNGKLIAIATGTRIATKFLQKLLNLDKVTP